MRLPEKWALESRCSPVLQTWLYRVRPIRIVQQFQRVSFYCLCYKPVGTVFRAPERWAPEEKHATSGSLQSRGIAGEEAHIAAPPVIYEGSAKRNISCVHLSGVPGP